MSEIPRVTVVVPVRDEEDQVVLCMDSLLALDYPRDRLELIAVDNGSRDGTLRVLRGYRDRIRVLTEDTPGPAAARNAGIDAASGQVVAFTDADCVADPGWLRSLVPRLQDPEVGIACGEVLAYAPGSPADRFGQSARDTRLAVEVYRPPYAHGANWASPRDLLSELGGFDVGFGRAQDVELSYRVLAHGRRIVHAPGAVVRHQMERTLWSVWRQGYRHGRSARRLERRHRALLDSYGHGRVNPPSWGRIRDSAVRSARGPGRWEAAYETAFLAGKRTGMAVATRREGAGPEPGTGGRA